MGLISTVFALAFSEPPDKKQWDKIKVCAACYSPACLPARVHLPYPTSHTPHSALPSPPPTHSCPPTHPQGYGTNLGKMTISNVTIASFLGSAGCGTGTYAIANNWQSADAFHPHLFSGMRVADDVAQDGMFMIFGPDPAWRNEEDCGEPDPSACVASQALG